ncbi:hypothetical protein HG530_002069 [Fusarium avenaceum]|nr:hypothetical protein HG530_002069 [Fusarium avenaceum]
MNVSKKLDSGNGVCRLTNALLRDRLNANHLSGQLLLLLKLIVLHEGESKNLTNGVVVGQEHNHSVNTHTPSTGRGQTILERGTEVLIDELGLVVTLVLLAGLLLEAQALVEGVVQLGVGVGDLLLAHESLETLAQTGDLTVVLGQRAHDLRVASDEGGVDTLLLDELTDQLVNNAGVGQRRCALQVHLLENSLEEVVGLLSVELITGRELLASSLLEGWDHLVTRPGLLPVDLVFLTTLGVELGLVATSKVLDKARNHVLGGLHEVVDISVGLVELNGCEFRVVGKISTLVTELASNFVNTVKTANHEHLKVKLGSNTHEHLHVVLVVMSGEGLGSSTTGNLVHHGSLNLNEVALVEVSADPGDHLGSSDEDVAGLLVADEIEVSLAVSLLEILEAVMVIGKGVETRSQEDDLSRKDGQLTLLTLLKFGLGSSSKLTLVLVLVLSIKSGSILSHLLSLAHDLDLDALSSDIVEKELGTGCSLSVDTGTNLDDLVLGVLAGLEVTIILHKLSQVVCDIELVGVWVGALGLAELVDVPGSDLEVLVGSKVLLSGLSTTSGSLLGSGSRSTLGSLLLLFLLLLAGLLALLQLSLGNLLTSYLIEVQVSDLLGRGGSSVSHNCVSFRGGGDWDGRISRSGV